ncbi:MAG TPA: ribosome recycling factor, partial [candidate division WOR-3 bacterium]|nr:ribosome recycling factor [candidate division WOR-3 bacterium]
IRREIKDKVKKMKNNGDISEDEELRFEKTLQEVTDKFVEKVEVILTKKEEEIMND